MAKRNELLASAGTMADLLESIARFYCGEARELVEDYESGGWLVRSVASGRLMAGVRVVKIRGRYRFEMI